MMEHMSASLKFGEWFSKIGEQSGEVVRFAGQFSIQDWSMAISLVVVLYGIMGLRNLSISTCNRRLDD